MRDCRKFEDIVARHLHGGVLVPEKEFLEGHLASCPACCRLYMGAVEADRVLRDIPGKSVDPPPYLRTRILAHLDDLPATSRWAAGFVRFAGVFAGVAACVLVAFTFVRGVSVPKAQPKVASVPSFVALSPSVPGTVAKVEPAAPAEAVPLPPRVVEKKRTASAEPVRIVKEVKVFFFYPQAARVAVTGDFNGWDPAGLPLKVAGRPGLWEVTLKLSPGAYNYNFIVDGDRLLPDPESADQMPDGFGGTNSILLVKGGNSI